MTPPTSNLPFLDCLVPSIMYIPQHETALFMSCYKKFDQQESNDPCWKTQSHCRPSGSWVLLLTNTLKALIFVKIRGSSVIYPMVGTDEIQLNLISSVMNTIQTTGKCLLMSKSLLEQPSTGWLQPALERIQGERRFRQKKVLK